MRPHDLSAVAICLLAGLALQTLVAWGASTYAPLTGGTGVLNNPTITPGSRSAAGFHYPADWTARSRVEWYGFGRVREFTSEQVWMGTKAGIMANKGRQAAYQGFGGGWPMISLVGTDYVTPELRELAPPRLVGGPSWLGARIAGTMYPVWPVFPAVVVNSLILAAPFWLGWWGVDRRRIARRRKSGLCVACAYPLGGATRCPECGNAAA